MPTNETREARKHWRLSRRYFLQLAATGAVTVPQLGVWAADSADDSPLLQAAIDQLEYLTKPSDFRIVGRGKPVPSSLNPAERRRVGLDRETWKLSITADTESGAQLGNPMTIANGKALDWTGLMELSRTHAVRYLKVMTCTNIGQMLGMGLWEGVPLRNVLALAKPIANIRRVFYYGYHNDDAKQRFQSSLSINRVLEDPPGEKPVLLCYKLNNEWLSPEGGAPVRVVVPEAYGNKSVKWLQHIVLTNNYQQNDTYATWNNDTESHLKTYARFLTMPKKTQRDTAIPITGAAQVGMSGLSKIQVLVTPKSESPSDDDPYLSRATWRDARTLGPPSRWAGGIRNGELLPIPGQIDSDTGRPLHWPLRDTIVHWAVLLPGLAAGKYVVRCRTIDANGYPQPLPRPLPKSGHNQIQEKPLVVVASL